MDMMLTLAEDGIHEFLWSDDLLDEWERVIIREGLRSAESAARLTSQVRLYFAEGHIPRHEYRHLVRFMPGGDPDDHLHMAAAIAGRADVIVTADGRDFPRLDLAKHGIRVLSPDEYLLEVVGEVPDEIILAVQRISDRRRRPPMTVEEIIDRVSNAGAKRFAMRLRDLLAMDETDTKTDNEPSGSKQVRWRAGWTKPREVAERLAHKTPPPYHVTLRVPKHVAIGPDAHSLVMEALIVHVLEAWPQGTAITVTYSNGTYAQALIYHPHVLLTEIGPKTEDVMKAAVGFEWHDPAMFTARHRDFKSQPIWQDNPFREWDCTIDDPREIGLFIQAGVQAVLGVDVSLGYKILIFNIHPDNWPALDGSGESTTDS